MSEWAHEQAVDLLAEKADRGHLPAEAEARVRAQLASGETCEALHRLAQYDGGGSAADSGGTFNCRAALNADMSDWPRDVGDHTITDQWVCTECDASFDCLSQFRRTDCS